MLVLALDTTTRAGSCAIARDGVLLREHAGDARRAHDTRLPAELMALLDAARLRLADVDVYAVATGPGSFTGLRIGIATMQGLAFAAAKPLVGVSALDALARVAAAGEAADATRIATWIDAWRGEVYASVYRQGEVVEPPAVAAPAALIDRYRQQDAGRWIFIGDGAGMHREAIERMGETASVAAPAAPPLAGTIAALAGEAVRAGHAPPPQAIRPLYVRRPDAELARDARPVR